MFSFAIIINSNVLNIDHVFQENLRAQAQGNPFQNYCSGFKYAMNSAGTQILSNTYG